MIRVTVELLPLGDERGKRTLGQLFIVNDGNGSADVGNYVGTLYAEYTGEDGREGYVSAFGRKRQSVWSLVGAFLKLWGHTKHPPKYMGTAREGREGEHAD